MTKHFHHFQKEGRSWLRSVASCFPLMLFLLLGSNISAQMVSGMVTSGDGSPLIGASVLEKGTNNGTITDVDGAFSLKLSKSSATLEVSYIGYTTQDVAVSGGQTGVKVMLSEGTALDEVVVTALGIERSKKNITYSVQEVSGDEIRNTR
ncbi:MAG: carboxypeptidase-like regulatory domain-containing protein, partial [Saprospiraceae bacterium]|nr:carboxypeptidase-like regulatory domain-containing protein [Saprospiraceae bacterium]